MVLGTLPTADVTIATARKSGSDHDTDLSVSAGSSLTFTTGNWNTAQTVTLSASEDNDNTDGTATFEHTATSSDAAYHNISIPDVEATEDDNDASVVVSPTSVTVDEGGTETYTIVLGAVPASSVTIATARKSGVGQDTDLTVSAGSSLTFTTGNWNTAQTVTLSAGEDSDSSDGTATFEHTATSDDSDYNNISIADVAATEDDKVSAGITLSGNFAVDEGDSTNYTVKLAARPSGNVTVAMSVDATITPPPVCDGDMTLSPTSLTFTSSNYNTAQRNGIHIACVWGYRCVGKSSRFDIYAVKL